MTCLPSFCVFVRRCVSCIAHVVSVYGESMDGFGLAGGVVRHGVFLSVRVRCSSGCVLGMLVHVALGRASVLDRAFASVGG